MCNSNFLGILHVCSCLCLTQPTVLVRIFLQFEAVGSAFYCWVNGTMVGYAQDTFLSSEFDVTKLLKPGSNLLAVQASPYGVAALEQALQPVMRFDHVQLSTHK